MSRKRLMFLARIAFKRMVHDSVRWRAGGGLIAALAVLGVAEMPQQKAQAEDFKLTPQPETVQLQGRVVCLAEEMHKLFQANVAAKHEHLYGFKTHDGKVYTLLRTKLSEALFVDQRLLNKELIVKGRVFPQTQILEVMGNLQSIRKGVVNDLFYYCDICAIESVAPGPCMCCQAPVELVERPLGQAP
ncbi:MAG: hypothetical protein AAB466_10755 [Verrucomicrobiota bacterium]